MSAGLSENSGAAKRKGNGRADTDVPPETKNAVAAIKPEDLLSQFMTLDGHSLRTVFERSIAAHTERVSHENSIFEDNKNVLTKRIFSTNTEIAELDAKANGLRNKVYELQDQTKKEHERHLASLAALDKERDLIENMRTLLKSKLEGVD